MAILTWPSNAIMDALKISSATFMLQRQRELSKGGDGTIYRKGLGPSIWTAALQSVPMTHDDAMAAEALIDTMDDDVGASFYVWNPKKPYPLSDPTGSILGSSTPTVLAVNSDNKRLSLQGLPIGYVLKRGDMLSIDYASTYRQLLRIAEASVTADGSGDTGLFEVSPHIRTGIATGSTVTLIKPSCKMIIMPGSLEYAAQAELSTIKFNAIEAP